PATGEPTYSTPTPREIYVEKLVSQNRNSTQSISGPTSVVVGQTYTYTVNASTATGGYEQLESFLNFPNSMFEVLSISTTYTAPTGATNNKIYADACGWDNNPSSASYRSCIGPANYSGGKAGGTIATTYTVRVIGSGGTATMNSLVYDFSGSSYHYGNDYGSQSITVTAQTPPDMTLTKSHAGNFTQGQSGSYTITATNSGQLPTSGTVTVTDTLPTGLTPTAAAGTGWTCSISGQTVTCTRSNVLAAGSSYPAITLSVSVAPNSPLSMTNTASVSGGGETNTGNDTASDPTTVNGVPDVTIAKRHSGNFTQGQTGTYTLTASNAGGAATSGTVTVSDTVPAGLTPTSATGTGWACSISGQTITCTRSDALAAGASYPAISLAVSVAPNSALSVTNSAAVSGGGQTNTAN